MVRQAAWQLDLSGGGNENDLYDVTFYIPDITTYTRLVDVGTWH